MKITIISVGKLKEKYLKLAIEEYSKRLSRYIKLNVVEVGDEKIPENLSKIQEEIIKNKEGDRILKHVKEGTYVVALDLKGQMLSSGQLADKLKNLAIAGNSRLIFIIGGSLGLSDKVLKRANYKLCFSLMTFPHQLMRVILLEQVYRSFKIIRGEPYHK